MNTKNVLVENLRNVPITSNILTHSKWSGLMPPDASRKRPNVPAWLPAAVLSFLVRLVVALLSRGAYDRTPPGSPR